MSTKISWTDETWNVVTGCSKISVGCQNCYAEKMAKRLAGRFGYPEAPNQFDVTLRPHRLGEPLKWRKPRKVFVCSMSDLFHPEVPHNFIDEVFNKILQCNKDGHIFQILTKRPERMKRYMESTGFDLPGYFWPPRNAWLGVTAENQETAEHRIPFLLDTPAAVRFVSIEPMLGPIDFESYHSFNRFQLERLDWVIAGGESGPGARPPNPDWFRSLRDQCVEAGVPFFFKQWGGPHHKGWVIDDKIYSDNILDGETWEQFPEVK